MHRSRTAVLVAALASLALAVAGCGSDDGERRVSLPRTRSQYNWSIGRTVDGEEVLEIKCSSEYAGRTQWQFALCHWGYDFRALLSRAR